MVERWWNGGGGGGEWWWNGGGGDGGGCEAGQGTLDVELEWHDDDSDDGACCHTSYRSCCLGGCDFNEKLGSVLTLPTRLPCKSIFVGQVVFEVKRKKEVARLVLGSAQVQGWSTSSNRDG